MTAPLYNNCEKPSQCDKDGNRGLWFERFFDQYNEHANWEVGTEKTRWLLDHFKNQKVGDSKQLERHAQAQIQLAKSLQGQSHVFNASWHFVTGMGNPHPVENGFAWHPTLGVPYLTGAAVKGLVRSYIENYLDDTPENRQKLLFDWFGSDHKKPEDQTYDSQAGNLIFFDALPVKSVTLGVDIMTPHMGKWYEKGGDKDANKPETIPADWHDPVPVAFLAAKDITLHFSFALRRPSTIDLKDVQQALKLALEHAGAGGKTATGYGGMQADPKALQDLNAIIEKQAKDHEDKMRQAEEAARLKAELANLSPLAAAFKQQAFAGNWEQNKDAFVVPGVIEEWLDKLEKENDMAVVSMLVNLIEGHLPSKLLDNPMATNKKGKAEFKPRQQQIGKRLNALRK